MPRESLLSDDACAFESFIPLELMLNSPYFHNRDLTKLHLTFEQDLKQKNPLMVYTKVHYMYQN